MNNNNNNNNNSAPSQAPAPAAHALQPAPMPSSPSVTSSFAIDNNSSSGSNNDDIPKYFFQEKYAPLNVKGNFLTLCACPKNVELGEWIAHQSMYPLRLKWLDLES